MPILNRVKEEHFAVFEKKIQVQIIVFLKKVVAKISRIPSSKNLPLHETLLNFVESFSWSMSQE